MLAGEFVLGTLDAVERASLTRRCETDMVFSWAVNRWEERLTVLVEASPEIAPRPEVWAQILARLGLSQRLGVQAPQAPPQVVVSLNRQVARWRRVAVASMAMAACLAAWVALDVFTGNRSRPEFIAVLQKTNEAPAFLMKADLQGLRLSTTPVSATATPGRSYELWLIDPEAGAPKPLGLLADSEASRTALPNLDPSILKRATYAVTIEPAGGSPSGAPTSSPVFFGHLLQSNP